MPIYDRGGSLWRPVRIDSPAKETDKVRRPLGTTVLRQVEHIWVRFKLAEVATWLRWDARAKGMVPDDVRTDIALTIATQNDLCGGWDLLHGVVSHPLLTLNGRVIATAGYDSGTGLLFDLEGDWHVPAAPTKDNAVGACANLEKRLRFFPWASPEDRAVALSLLLTVIARPVLPAAPMHCLDAPEAGTGKSLLVDVAAILATGLPAPVVEYGRDPIEAGKRLDTMLIAGDQIIALDNVEAPLEGASLCQTLSQPPSCINIHADRQERA